MARDLEIDFIHNFECPMRNHRSRISLIKQVNCNYIRFL